MDSTIRYLHNGELCSYNSNTVSERNQLVVDTLLTRLGEKQAANLRSYLLNSSAEDLDAIWVTPLRRTVQTAAIATNAKDPLTGRLIAEPTTIDAATGLPSINFQYTEGPTVWDIDGKLVPVNVMVSILMFPHQPIAVC